MTKTITHGEASIRVGLHGETIGRIVHYVSATRAGPQVWAAVIVEVHDDGFVTLEAFGVEGLLTRVAHSSAYKCGYWSWPPRIDDGARA